MEMLRVCLYWVWAPLYLLTGWVSSTGMSSYSSALQGPFQRSEPGTNIQLTFRSSGFSTDQVTVTWLKNSHQLLKSQTSVHPRGDTYNVTSSVVILLQADDVHSLVHCQVKHMSILVSQKTIRLEQYLRGKDVLFVQMA